MKKIIIDSSFLSTKYVEENMTLSQIAEELGVSRQTVSNKLQEFGIEIRNSKYIRTHKKIKRRLKKKYKWRDKADFQRVYTELRSIPKVAEHYKIDVTTAYDWKIRHGLDTVRPEYATRKTKPNLEGKPYTDKVWLSEMYSRYSWEDLGKMLGVHPTTLSKWGYRLGIVTRTPREQWAVKSKNGNLCITSNTFRSDTYMSKYAEKPSHLSPALKNFIIKLYGRCESCGETEVLDLHHINEVHTNNHPANHACLCPNCHAKIHRLGVEFNMLVKQHINWIDLIPNGYQEAK